ncbi:MAG: hypothetical protein A2Y23_15500 [Clostridiales bacterium GWB2_37_7]|nr:MAG: hypothetical protein A2Y23_15500 [Clostridiales bacterium GWB2_37_7]
MGRPTRVDYKGGIYHVIARGNNKELIFIEDKDKGHFISVVKKSCEIMGCKVYGYALMNNHYHILMQTMDKKLQEIMHKVNNTYSKYFNLKYERVGHVFQGRYKSCIIQDETYMFNVLRYIHQNPIEAGLCNKAQDYAWTSDKYYRGKVKGFVDTSLILDMFSNDLQAARKKYIGFIDESIGESYEDMEIIGDEAFKVLYASKKKPLFIRKSLDEILIETGVSAELFNLIKIGARKRCLTSYKLQYIKNAMENKYTYAEIGNNINVSGNAIKEMYDRNRNI